MINFTLKKMLATRFYEALCLEKVQRWKDLGNCYINKKYMTGKFVFLLGPNLLGSLLTWFKDSAPLETLTINNCKILYTPKDWDYSSSLSYALIFEIINYPYLFIAFFCRKMALIARWRQLRVERKPGVTFQKCSSCAFCLADKRCTPPFRPPPPHAPFGPSASIASALVISGFPFPLLLLLL